nr:hypothetical protein [Amazonocrinis nigriterrae]
MHRVVLIAIATQKHFFAALGNYTKGRNRDSMTGFHRRGGTVEVQSFQRLNRPIMTDSL